MAGPRSRAPGPQRATGAAAAASLRRGDVLRAVRIPAVARLRDPRLTAGDGCQALRQSDFTGARAYLERMAAGSRQAGDRSAEARAHDLLGRVACEEGAVDRADEELAVAMRLFCELQDVRGQARVLWHLNMIATRRGDLEASASHIERFAAIVRAVDDPWSTGHAHLAPARLGLARGDHEGVIRDVLIALRMLGAVGDRWSLANALRFGAALVIERDAKEQALVLLGAADAMDEAIGARPGPAISAFIAGCRERRAVGCRRMPRAPPSVAAGAWRSPRPSSTRWTSSALAKV